MKFGWQILAVCLLLFADCPAQAQEQHYVVEAHPALWMVQGPAGRAYLFGSIHLLPPNVHWQTPKIETAMKSADVFVFETPMGPAAAKQIQAYVQKNGSLPAGVTLTSLLSPEQKKDYDAALATTGVRPEAIADKRPWLASLMLDVAKAFHERFALDSGVDHQVHAYAVAHRKAIGHFESVSDQLALLNPGNKSLEIKEFDIDLKQIVDDPDDLSHLVTAWETGNAADVAKIMNGELADDPSAAKALLYDRNARWVGELKIMLKRRHTYFITVGAGHLVGPKGVPAMLRAAGYKVERQ
jgi:uncharacterized protein